jgi:hypothetical protein
MSARTYEIWVEEPLEERWSSWFGEMIFLPPDDAYPSMQGTCMQGVLPDQPALFGLLARIRDLNLTLIALRRLA